MLDFVVEAAEDAGEITTTTGDGQLNYIHHWAGEMLQRVMVSRKVSDPDILGSERSPYA